MDEARLKFLLEVLRATAESRGNPEVVYPLLQANQAQLDATFAEVLRRGMEATLAEVEEEQAQGIAGVIGSFSNLISDFPLGNRASNLEIAITGYQIIQTVFTREKSPETWVKTQNNLGIAYLDRIRGEKADNIEAAISAYEAALSVSTRQAFPVDWATTQNNLGNAYSNRIRGEKADNIEAAISAYEAALSVYTRSAFPVDWAMSQNNLGNAYQERIRGEKADNIEAAISAYEAALSVCTRSAFPVDWAMSQNGLGIAYSKRIRGEKADNIEAAISAFQAALEVRTRSAFPQQWAMSQNHLGIAYKSRIRGEKAENLEAAISAYEAALEVLSRSAFPQQWAMTQNNLGIAYSDRIRGEQAENLEAAISAFQAALEVRTRSAFPVDWAMSQNNLGIAYKNRIRGEKVDNLEAAISAFQAALKVRTRSAFPQQWATTQNNLGNAYLYRIRGEEAENLEAAISAFQAALSVSTRQAFPVDWATTQNNLGDAYLYRVKGEKAENLEAAISAFQAALSVSTRSAFPVDWATNQNNLGYAYQERIRGEKADNIEAAISAYEAALSVYTRQAFPVECLRTATNLGNLHFSVENWSASILAYDEAIQAVEVSRSWGLTELGRQEILERAIEVYRRVIQASLNDQQLTLALEYAERSKARNLVELVARRDLEPQGDLYVEVREKLANLRREIRVQQRQLSQERDKPEIAEASKRKLTQLNQQLNELIEQEIKPLDPSFSLTQRVETMKWSDIQGLLAEDTAIVEWYLTGEEIVTFVISQDSKLTVWRSKREERQALVDWVNEYLDGYSKNKSKWRDSLASRLNSLAKILHLEQILQLIPETCSRLILIPHIELHLFPLHALQGKRQRAKGKGEIEGTLMELFPDGVSYAPSCQILQQLQKRQRDEFSNLFVLQTPTKDLYESDLGAVGAIKKQFPNSRILKKNQAKKVSLMQRPDPKNQQTVIFNQELIAAHCLFFFCHGYYNADDPLDSGLQLADGSLTLSEVLLDFKLENCRLVTLAACETAMIDFTNTSDEYIGLPSGFLLAGSTNVVSSLWTVSATATALLMTKFYQELQQEKRISVALATAQKWLRETTVEGFRNWLPNSPLSDDWQDEIDFLYFNKIEQEQGAATKCFESPFYWAAFCAIGNGF